MKDSLQTLNRIQKFNIDEQRKVLAELSNRQDMLLADLEHLNEAFEHEKEFAAVNIGMGDFGAYTKRYLQQKAELEGQIAALEKQIEHERDIMADMFKEQKTYEIVGRKRKERREAEEELKTQKELDEIGTNSYIKHHRE